MQKKQQNESLGKHVYSNVAPIQQTNRGTEGQRTKPAIRIREATPFVETVHNKTDSTKVHMTTQIGKFTRLIPYPSSLSNYHNYNIILS